MGPSARGPYMQRTPAWLLAKATRTALNKALFVSLKHSLYFLSVKLRFSPCCSYVTLKVGGPGQFFLVLLGLIWKSQAGMMGACSVFLLVWGERSQVDNSSRPDIAELQSQSVCEELRQGSCTGLTAPENMRERWRVKDEGEEVLNELLKRLSN